MTLQIKTYSLKLKIRMTLNGSGTKVYTIYIVDETLIIYSF